MAQSEPTWPEARVSIDRVARQLECESVCDVARAALEVADASVARRCGRRATAAAALRVASRRAGRVELEAEDVSSAFGVDPASAELAESFLLESLSPPASASEISSLRRSTNALRELVIAAENGRANAPRLPPSVLAVAAPQLAGSAHLSLERLDTVALRAHLERLEADLEMARLGVELSVAVTDRRRSGGRPR